MTRINLVNPCHLSDKHLGAEYRELPRLFGLVRKAQHKGLRPGDLPIPRSYVLGKGHVLFFYNKLKWLQRRQENIIEECLLRGRVVTFPSSLHLLDGIDPEWINDWCPSIQEIRLNVKRINERGGLRPVCIGI